MPPTRGPKKRLLPSTVIALTGLAVIVATAAWLSVRSRERDQVIRDHVESQQVVAETGAAGIAAILDGFASDLDRLSRVASVRYLEQPERLVRTLDSFLSRTSVPARALIRVDTTGRVLVLHPRDALPGEAIDALRASGYLARAGASRERLVSASISVPGGQELIALSDLIQPDDRDPLGAIIALFPASFLATPIERAGHTGGHWVVLRDDQGHLLHRSGDDGLEGVASAAQEEGESFVARAPVASEVEPRMTVELWSSREEALAPLSESFVAALFLLLLTNGVISIGGGFLARELWLRQRLNESLERRGELENRLHEAQKLESLGRLAGGIAHDFNNALTAIQGSARLLQERLGPDGPEREETAAILQASSHAAELTRQLLSFARRQTLRPRVIDLNQALRQIEPILRRTLPEDVRVAIEPSPTPSWIRMDPTHLQQLLLNLAVNARDAMPKGGNLRISTADGVAEEEGGNAPEGYARLTVSDDGAGIPADVLPHVFEPFFTTKAATAGTGLGLATVYGIVKQSGGDIRVETGGGAGTRFVLLFPRAEPCSAEEVAAEQQEVLAPEGDAMARSATILLVEDNAAVRRVAERALKRRGHRIITAASGEEALSILSDDSLHIDLLLTDVVMPGINGRELADRVTVSRADLAVLFMSGYMQDEVLERGLQGTETHYLEKPFTPDELVRSVQVALADSPKPGPGLQDA